MNWSINQSTDHTAPRLGVGSLCVKKDARRVRSDLAWALKLELDLVISSLTWTGTCWLPSQARSWWSGWVDDPRRAPPPSSADKNSNLAEDFFLDIFLLVVVILSRSRLIDHGYDDGSGIGKVDDTEGLHKFALFYSPFAALSTLLSICRNERVISESELSVSSELSVFGAPFCDKK